MKSRSLLVLAVALGGCSPKTDLRYEKPETWGIRPGFPIVIDQTLKNRPLFFEPSLSSLPRFTVSEVAVRNTKDSLLVGNYPKLGEIAQFCIHGDTVKLRDIVNRDRGSESFYGVKEVWKIAEFVQHFARADVRVHPNLDVGTYYESSSQFPTIQTASGRLTIDQHDNGMIYFLEVYLDRGLVVATKASHVQELD